VGAADDRFTRSNSVQPAGVREHVEPAEAETNL